MTAGSCRKGGDLADTAETFGLCDSEKAGHKIPNGVPLWHPEKRKKGLREDDRTT